MLAINVTGGLQNALDKVLEITPKLLLFVVVLVVGWIIAKVVRNVVDRLLDRVGYNKAVDKSGIGRWLGNQKGSTLTAKLVYYALLLFTLQLAFGVFGTNPVSSLIESVVSWIPKAFIAVVIVVVAATIARAVRDIAEGALGQLAYGPTLAKLIQFAIVALGVIAALNQVGIATAVTQPVLITALATVGGILVVGLGGGLVTPMRARWEKILNRAEQDTSAMLSTQSAGKGNAFTQPSYSGGSAATREDTAAAAKAEAENAKHVM